MKKLSYTEIWSQILNNKIDFVEISVCADDSFIILKKKDKIIYELKNLSHNNADLIQLRVGLQDILKEKNVNILSAHKTNVCIKYQLKVGVGKKPIYLSYLTEGISNKYNRLTIKKIPANEKSFHTAQELADTLRVNIMTIYRYIKARKLRAYKIGKEFRIDKTEFQRFLDKVKTK